MQNINLSEAREYLLKLLPEAGKILENYFNSGEFTSKRKEGVDFTTQADIEVDKFLSESLKQKFPGTNFLTEETAPKDYSELANVENLWVIDPLDGTINFSRKHPNFSISVGFVNKAESQLGVVYVPMTKDIYWAQIDQDEAYLNGKPIKVSGTDNLTETVLACDWSWNLERRLDIVKGLKPLSQHIRQIKSMGSGVADLASLGAGKIDVYFHAGLKPWDIAAAGLIVQKAGGKITTPSGDKWNVFEPDILASNGILHDKILELINY